MRNLGTPLYINVFSNRVAQAAGILPPLSPQLLLTTHPFLLFSPCQLEKESGLKAPCSEMAQSHCSHLRVPSCWAMALPAACSLLYGGQGP